MGRIVPAVVHFLFCWATIPLTNSSSFFQSPRSSLDYRPNYIVRPPLFRSLCAIPQQQQQPEGDGENRMEMNLVSLASQQHEQPKQQQFDFVPEDVENPWMERLSTLNNQTQILQQEQQAVWLLNAVAILWGTQHAVIKTVVSLEPSSATTMVTNSPTWVAVFTLVRFALAAILATPGIFLQQQQQQQQPPLLLTTDDTLHDYFGMDKRKRKVLWRWANELGFWMFLGFAFQAIGLEYTTAQKSAFLLYLNCKFVPFFAALFWQRPIAWETWLSAAAAVVGTAFLAGPTGEWNIGDLWSIAAAMASAFFILRTEQASQDTAVERIAASQLNAACLWVVTAWSALWTILVATASAASETTMPANMPNLYLFWNDDTGPLEPSTWWSFLSFYSDMGMTRIWSAMEPMIRESGWSILYLSGICTALGNWIQTRAQRWVSAERACILYAMDPVYGAIFSAWWLGESLPGPLAYFGAALITIAAATNALLMDQEKTTKTKT